MTSNPCIGGHGSRNLPQGHFRSLRFGLLGRRSNLATTITVIDQTQSLRSVFTVFYVKLCFISSRVNRSVYLSQNKEQFKLFQTWPKNRHSSFLTKSTFFKIAQKVSANISAIIARKLLAKSFQKSPSLVTLEVELNGLLLLGKRQKMSDINSDLLKN